MLVDTTKAESSDESDIIKYVGREGVTVDIQIK